MDAAHEQRPRPWGILLVLAAAWFGGVRLLGPQWSVYEQYQYGWAVPFLCLYLLWLRWPDRPPPATHFQGQSEEQGAGSREREGGDASSEGGRSATRLTTDDAARSGVTRPTKLKLGTRVERVPTSARTPLLLLLGAGLLLLPTRIIVEANLIWRVGSWALAGELVIITLAVIALAGGKPWLKHFGFATAFFLVAVPWPSQWEGTLTQGLMRWNTGIVVELMSLLGIPALQHGNVIEVSQGMVGVDEACSGIRSLQATLMISLFFGELCRLTTRRRLLLVAAGAGSALLCNVARTAVLVWVSSRSGLAAMEHWHDPTGVAILLVCFGTLWLVATWMGKKQKAEIAKAETGADGTPAAGKQSGWPHVRVSLAVGLGVWLVAVEVVTAVWFGVRGDARADVQNWSVRWPEEKGQFRDIKFSPRVLSQLKAQEAKSAAWTEADGSAWQVFHFRWGPAHTLAERVQVNMAKSHRPEICLPAAGKDVKTDRGIKEFFVQGLRLPIHALEFSDNGRSLFVYFCPWEDGTRGAAAELRENNAARLRAAWRGNRVVSQRVLEVAVWGKATATAADAALAKVLEEMITR